MKAFYEPRPYLLFYKELLDDLYVRLKRIGQFNVFLRGFKCNEYVGVSGLGLNVIKRLRNKIAHGNLQFPEPDEPYFIYEEIVEISSNILVLTIQMLLIAFFEDSGYSIGFTENGKIDYTYEEAAYEVTLEDYLYSIHLIFPERGSEPLKLF